jgi:hypothetical protein
MPVLRSLSRALPLLLAAVLAGGCATYGERVAPVPLPEASPQAVSVDGAQVVAQAYMDPGQAERALGFDARGAGLIPVRFVIDNGSEGVVRLRPEQTFLLDREGNAWPLLTSEQAYKRVRAHVGAGETLSGAGESTLLGGAAGAVAGLAIGVLTGRNVAETVGKGAVVGGAAGAIGGGASRYQELDREIRTDLEEKGLRLRRVPAGELAYGYLFFPGKDEAGSALSLRLGLEVAGQGRVVELPL